MNGATGVLATPALDTPAASSADVVPSPFAAASGGPPLLDPSALRAEPTSADVQAWWDALVAAGLDVRQPAALLTQLDALLVAATSLDGQDLLDNLAARAALVRGLVDHALVQLGPALERAGTVAGALPVTSPIVDYVAGRENLVSAALQSAADITVLVPFPLSAAVSSSTRLAGFLTSDAPEAQAVKAAAIEFAQGVYDGFMMSGLVDPSFGNRFYEQAVANARALHVLLPTVVDAGLAYGIVIQPLVDVLDLVKLVFGDLMGIVKTLQLLGSAAVADPTVAHGLGVLIGQQQASSFEASLFEAGPATFYFTLSTAIGELLQNTVLSATGAGLVVVVGTKALRATKITAAAAKLLVTVVEHLPGSAPGRERLVAALRAMADAFDNRWRLLEELAGDSEEVLAAIRRLLARDDLRKLLYDLSDHVEEARADLDPALPGGLDANLAAEITAREAQVLAVLTRLGGMTDVELDGVSAYRRIWSEDGPPRGMTKPWTDALGSPEGAKGGNQDTRWFDLLDEPADGMPGPLERVAPDHPVATGLWALLGELDPVTNGRGLYAVLVDFWAGDSKTAGAIGSLYGARDLYRELSPGHPDVRFDFEITFTGPEGRRDLDVVVFRGDDSPPDGVMGFLLVAEIKNIVGGFISDRLKSQMARDLARHIGAGDVDFEKLRWLVPEDQLAMLEGPLGDAFRAAINDDRVQDAIATSPHDMIDVMTRLDTAIRNGRLIGSFGVNAP
ncbi:hypothetical protein [Spirillospora sp. NPDC047279]|uniref:hypothetical protein n=1 Tax=Spirillospora sp. NPDC047279 TaxID=3155478 RepID=UPI003407E291